VLLYAENAGKVLKKRQYFAINCQDDRHELTKNPHSVAAHRDQPVAVSPRLSFVEANSISGAARFPSCQKFVQTLRG